MRSSGWSGFIGSKGSRADTRSYEHTCSGPYGKWARPAAAHRRAARAVGRVQ